jgi:hypothetical protein
MDMTPAARCAPACTLALASLFAAPGCSGTSAATPQTGGLPPAYAAGGDALQPSVTQRCTKFAKTFDVDVACERADGTLRSFPNEPIGWRVRYFVRYRQMPCNEAPTEEESYVFHAVLNDLYGDADLSDAQRLAIRTAMYEGTPRCK